MLSNQDQPFDELNFICLPQFCSFILENNLHQFVEQQISLARELKIPVLKGMSQLSGDQLFNYALQMSKEFLENLSNNKAGERLQQAMSDWKNNRLLYHQKNSIEP